jgi:hypothetical protein
MSRKPLLVDYRGQPIAYSDFFQAGNPTQRQEYPARFYAADYDTANLLSACSLKTLRSAGRFLFANVDIIRGALLEQASYSFPLHARYTGADKAWGADIAEPWLWEWKKSNNLRGGVYDSHTNSRLRLLGYKVDGDIGTVLTFDELEYPKLQYIRGHRIGNREWGDRVKDGPYKGRKLCNGVVLDDYNRTIAYLVLGDTKEQDQYVDAGGMILTYSPDYFDQMRGISHLVASIRPFAAIKRLHEYELRAHQAQSAYAAVIKNESGEADSASDAFNRTERSTGDEGAQATLTTQTLEDGLIQYVKAASGSGVELLRPDRPGPGSQSFWDTIIRGALYGIGWDPDFALAIKEPGGAWARTILQKVNKAVRINVVVEAFAQRREDWYAINKAIELGRIPGPSDGDTWSWEYQLAQREITADSGNELNAQRQGYILGINTLDELIASRGGWWVEHRDQREREVRDKLDRAKGILVDYPELGTIQLALKLIEDTAPMVKFDAAPQNTEDQATSGTEEVGAGNSGGNGDATDGSE